MTPGARTPTPAADPWQEVCAARLPSAHLAALGPIRDRAEVKVFPAGDTVWVRWPAGMAGVVPCLLPILGVALFVNRGGVWYGFRSRLPTADRPPEGEGESVATMLAPGRFDVAPPPDMALRPVRLRVVRGGEPRPATALACPVAALQPWADTATTLELAAVRAARSGPHAVLLGTRLPAIAGAVRFWGDDVFVPLGFHTDPHLAPAAIRAAAGAAVDELVFLGEGGADLIPRAAFEPLTRARVRLAVAEGGPP